MNGESGPTILTMKEAADFLRIGGSTLYKLAAEGVVPVVKIPGTAVIRIRRAALETLLERWEGGQRRGRRNGGGR